MKALVLSGIYAAAPLAWGAVTTNVWQTAAGGSINSAANWVGATEDWTVVDANRGFLDFRALDSGKSVTMADSITFSGFWFAPAPEATGPFTWSLPTDNTWWVGSSPVPLRVSGTIAWSGTRLAVGDYPLATASEIVLEEGAGWQTSPTYAKQPSPRFAVRDNGNGTKTLLFRVLANGTIVLFR